MVLSALIGAWATTYAVVAAVMAWRRRPRVADLVSPTRQRVLLLRPFTGGDPAAAEAMATVPPRLSDVHLRWIACVADIDDPAWPIACSCAEVLRAAGIDADALITGAGGPNRKAGQLAAAMAAATASPESGPRPDVVVVVDADVDLGSLALRQLVAPLASRNAAGTPVGIVWSPPVETAPRTAGDRLSTAILGGSWHAFGLLVRLDPHLLVGKAFAVRTDVLAATGGFAGLREHLGEDFELERRVHAAGFASRCTDACVHSMARDRTVGAVIDRYVRWLWVIRAQRPARLLAYPLLLAAAPLLTVAGLVAGLASGSPVGPAAAALTVITRGAVTTMAARRGGLALRPRLYVDGWAADLALLWAWLRVFTAREVRWADRTLRIAADGRLETTTP